MQGECGKALDVLSTHHREENAVLYTHKSEPIHLMKGGDCLADDQRGLWKSLRYEAFRHRQAVRGHRRLVRKMLYPSSACSISAIRLLQERCRRSVGPNCGEKSTTGRWNRWRWPTGNASVNLTRFVVDLACHSSPTLA